MIKRFKRGAIVLVAALALLLAGCGAEPTIYNISVRDVVLDQLKNESVPHMDEYVFYGAIGNKQVRYKFENADLFQSTVKLQKLYKASNPDEPLKLDLIINSDIDRITAVAISPKK